MRRRTLLRASAATLAVPTIGCPSAAGTASYEPVGSVSVDGAKDCAVHHGGEVVYVAVGDGIAAVDVSSPDDPRVLAERRDVDAPGDEPMREAWDVWPWRDRLVVAGPAQPAADAAHGFALFDVSDPADPVQAAFHPTDFHVHNTFFADDVVYLVGTGLDDEPVVMVDVTDDDPREIGRWSIVDHEASWREVDRSLRTLHDLYVQDGVAYLIYWDAGTVLLDVGDPTEPEPIARVGGYDPEELLALDPAERDVEASIPPGNHHYGQVDEDGELLAVGVEGWTWEFRGETVGGPGGVHLYDVSDPASPDHLARIAPPESYDQSREGWFTTAHNLDVVGDRLYSSWYYGGVRVHDVSDPSDPTELAWWRDPTAAAFWTARSAVPGEYFVASSTADPGKELGAVPADAGTREAVYVFPDRAGTQADPVDLTEPPGEGT